MIINELTYQGSKKRFINVLKPLIENNLDEGMTYIEPFGGGMNSFTPIQSTSKIAGDNNEYNIALWRDIKEKGLDAVLSEWEEYVNVLANCEDRPSGPNYRTAKKLYKEMKEDCLSDGGKFPKSLLGFVAYSCSYGGGWWNGFVGYNPKKGENYIKNAIKGLKKQTKDFKNLTDAIFVHGEYDAIDIPDNAFIYCDPPYSGTKQYAKSFNSEAFWDWCRYLLNNKENIKILISEYNAPEDFICIWASSTQDKMGTNNMSKREKLFIHNSQSSKFNLSSLSETVKISRADINEMVMKCVARILKENQFDEMQAWHGSANKFDKFDLSYVGSGEGSQVYGHGVYLTDVKDTGRWYAATIAIQKNKGDKSNTLRVLIGYLKDATFKWQIRDEINDRNFEEKKQKVINNLKEKKQGPTSRPKTREQAQQLIDMILPIKTAAEFKQLCTNIVHRAAKDYSRLVYTVEAPDTGYIDWTSTDRAFLKDIFDKVSQKFDTSHVDFNSVENFGDMFEKLRGWISKKQLAAGEAIPQKALSEFLHSLGFTGIRVPTGYKRGGDGRGTNIVVFDANQVKITGTQNMKGKENF
jgi:DNA adenine methylase